MKDWLTATLTTLSAKSDLAVAMRYATSRWTALNRCRDDGYVEIDSTVAERALRLIARGRKNYLFCGSDSRGERAAAIYKPDRHRQTQRLQPRGPSTRRRRLHRRLPRPPSTMSCPGITLTRHVNSRSTYPARGRTLTLVRNGHIVRNMVREGDVGAGFRLDLGFWQLSTLGGQSKKSSEKHVGR